MFSSRQKPQRNFTCEIESLIVIERPPSVISVLKTDAHISLGSQAITRPGRRNRPGLVTLKSQVMKLEEVVLHLDHSIAADARHTHEREVFRIEHILHGKLQGRTRARHLVAQTDVDNV